MAPDVLDNALSGEDAVPLDSLQGLQPQTRMALLETSRVFTPGEIENALETLAECGWNSVVLPGWVEGYPIFQSDVWAQYGLRRQHPDFRKWNPFETAFRVASRRGLEIFISYSPYLIRGKRENAAQNPILRRYSKWAALPHPRRARRVESGEEPPDFNRYFCPVNRDYRRFLCDALHDVLEGYPFHGLVLDLRHYPFYTEGRSAGMAPWCYCAACREDTLRDLGFDPVTVDFNKELGMVERWREWQASQMDEALEYIRSRALKARSNLRVLGLLTRDAGPDAKARRPLIHWKTWGERALVEAFVLDGYTQEQEGFKTQLQSDLEALSENMLLLPMAPERAPEKNTYQGIFETLSLPGFIQRFGNWRQPDFDPLERMEFERPAFPVESDPIRSIRIMFRNLENLAVGEEEFAAFLRDLAYSLTREDKELDMQRLTMISDNIKGLLTKVQEGLLNFGEHQDQVIHDLDLAYRLVYLAFCDIRG